MRDHCAFPIPQGHDQRARGSGIGQDTQGACDRHPHLGLAVLKFRHERQRRASVPELGQRIRDGDSNTWLGVVEVAGLPGGRLLVLERGFTAGVGNTVRLYAADTRRATDTAGVAVLTGQEDDRAGDGTGHGGGVRLVRKTLLADLVNCPFLGASAKQPQPNPLLDNIEGMTVTGAARTGGRLEVLLVSDDNQNAVQTTRLYALRVRVA